MAVHGRYSQIVYRLLVSPCEITTRVDFLFQFPYTIFHIAIAKRRCLQLSCLLTRTRAPPETGSLVWSSHVLCLLDVLSLYFCFLDAFTGLFKLSLRVSDMADIVPAPPPPPAGDENRQEILTAFLLWVVLLADIVVAVRVAVRVFIVRIRLWWDDFFIVAAAVRKLGQSRLLS